MFGLSADESRIVGQSAFPAAAMLGAGVAASQNLDKLRKLESGTMQSLRRGMSEEAFESALKASGSWKGLSLPEMLASSKTYGNLMNSKAAQLGFDSLDKPIALSVGLKYGMPVGAAIAAAPLAIMASKKIGKKIDELRNR